MLTPPLAAAGTRETWLPLRTPAAACRRRGRGRCQAPLTRAPHLRATPSSCGTVAGPASLPPGAVPARPVSAQGGVLRGESRLPLRLARLPRPTRSEVAAFGSSRCGARASLPTLVGACESASGNAGGGGSIGELPPLLALDLSYPAVFTSGKLAPLPGVHLADAVGSVRRTR